MENNRSHHSGSTANLVSQHKFDGKRVGSSKLVFRNSGGKLTRDAKYVCQLLTIDPEDLVFKPYESFSEKGLSEQR